MKRTIAKTAAIILAVSMLLTGCGGDATWAFESGGVKMPTGVYVMLEISAVAKAGTRISELNENKVSAQLPLPEILGQTIDGVPAGEFIASETMKRVGEYYTVKAQFEQRGLALTEAESMAVASAVNTILNNNRELYERNGVAESSVREFYTASAYKTALFNAIYGVGGEREVPVKELEAHFAENYFMADAIPIYKPFYGSSDDENALERELAAIKGIAETGLADLKSGSKTIEQLAYEVMLRSVGEDETARAAVTMPKTEDIRMTVVDSDRGTYGDKFIDTLKATPVGEYALVEDDTFFILFRRADVLADAKTLTQYRPLLLNELKGDEFDAELAAMSGELRLIRNDPVLTRFTVEKLKLDTTARGVSTN